MLKKGLLISLLLAFILPLSANRVTDISELPYFREVSLRVAANLYIEQGDEAGIAIETNRETLDKLIVEVVDRRLIIRFGLSDRLFSNIPSAPITLKLTAPAINMLSIQGSGSIIADKPIQTKILSLRIAGSGDIKLSDVQCERLEANISGSGDIVLSGSKGILETDITIAGSGNYKGSQLKSEAGYVSITGSGDCELNVTERLEVKILGSGSVYYKGNPTVEGSISGSGKITDVSEKRTLQDL
jgi:hypothetical protein